MVAVLLVQTPMAMATANDAGSGQDAPGSSEAALEVDLGTYNGSFGWWNDDYADWYRVTVPPGKALQVDIQLTDGYASIEPCDGFAPCSYGNVYVNEGEVVTLRLPATDGWAAFGLTWGTANYTFTTSTFDIADLWVADVSIEPVPVQVGGTELEVTTKREVTFRVGNVGHGPSVQGVVEAWVDQRGSSRRIALSEVALEPGDEETWTLTWDTIGQAGDATVRVVVRNAFEADPVDNEATASAHLFVGGTGYGFDVFNHEMQANVPVTVYDLEAGAYHRDGTPGVRAWVGHYDWFWDSRETDLHVEARVPARDTWMLHVCWGIGLWACASL